MRQRLRQEQHEHQAEFQHQRGSGRKGMKPVRQMLYVPADPGGQRAVLVVVVHGGEVSPLNISAGQLHHARFEVDAKPLPLQQEQAGARRRTRPPQARPESSGSEEQRDESGLQQHAVRLIAGEILRRCHERKKADEADEQHAPRPHVHHQQDRSENADPADRHQHVIAARQPQQCGNKPEARRPEVLFHRFQISAGRKNSFRTDEPLDLEDK